MAIATALPTRHQAKVVAGNHEYLSDTTWQGVGGDTAPTPHDFLDSSLAACIAMTIRIAADARKTALDGVSVEVTHVRDAPQTIFRCVVTLEGDLTEKERAGLLRVAHHCPISKLLEKTIVIGITAA